MKEEEYLKQRFGQKHPFRVPDDYFEHFADQMMATLAELPEQASAPDSTAGTQSARTVELRPHKPGWWRPMAIAASICALVMFGGWWIYKDTNPSPVASMANNHEVSQGYTVDQIADYAMLDNMDMYLYVADSY